MCRSRRELSNEYLLAKFGYRSGVLQLHADTWVSSLFSFLREGLDDLACLLASIQPRTRLVKFARSPRTDPPGSFLVDVLKDLGRTLHNRELLVISVIGGQSSAKSTLMNYLFGCGFTTAAGRCTKGLYASLMQASDGRLLLLPKLKDSIGEGSNHSNFSHHSSIKILSRFNAFC